jgi:hypothetical protein
VIFPTALRDELPEDAPGAWDTNKKKLEEEVARNPPHCQQALMTLSGMRQKHEQGCRG